MCVCVGEVFIQAKGVLEDVYKIYCYHHDEASALLKSYDTQEDAQQHFRMCISALKYAVKQTHTHKTVINYNY